MERYWGNKGSRLATAALFCGLSACNLAIRGSGSTAASGPADGAGAIAITSPAANSYVNSANAGAFVVSGTCSGEGRTITLSGAASGSATCTNSSWSATLDLTASAQGNFTLNAAISTGASGTASDARAFSKDTVPPTVAVTAPNGGETLAAAGASNITWTATDATSGVANSILIEYSANGGSTYSSVSSGETNDGTYSWTVPSSASTTALIRVTATDAAGNLASDV